MKKHPGPPSFLASLLPLPSTDPWEPAGALRGQPVPTDGTTGKCQVIQVPTSSAMLSTAWTTRWNMSLKFVCGFFPMRGRKKTPRGLGPDNAEGFLHGQGCFHCSNQPFRVGRTCTNKGWMCTWSLAAGLGGWQMGLNYKRCFDTTNKDEELVSVVIRRDDERVCSYRVFKMLLWRLPKYFSSMSQRNSKSTSRELAMLL